MNNEKNEGSPFSALTYQEQQEKWRLWRSRHMEYREADLERPAETDAGTDGRGDAPPVLPGLKIAAPTRHAQLDAVLKRHETARKHAGAFTTASQKDGSAK